MDIYEKKMKRTSKVYILKVWAGCLGEFQSSHWSQR